MHFEMTIFQVLAKIIVFGNYFSPIVPLRLFNFFFFEILKFDISFS